MSCIELDCPYCDNKQWEEIDGMTEYDIWTIRCDKCCKKFKYRIEYSVECYTDKIEGEDIEIKESQGRHEA